MTQATDIDMRELKSAIEANSREIAQLATEMRVGFANVDTKFAGVDTKFAGVDTKLAEIRGEITEVRGDIKALDSKFEVTVKDWSDWNVLTILNSVRLPTL
jgi:chromosome segregation ATPase